MQIIQYTDESFAHDTNFERFYPSAIGYMFQSYFSEYSYGSSAKWEGNKLRNLNDSGIKQLAKYY
jgi:hypothetical protein